MDWLEALSYLQNSHLNMVKTKGSQAKIYKIASGNLYLFDSTRNDFTPSLALVNDFMSLSFEKYYVKPNVYKVGDIIKVSGCYCYLRIIGISGPLSFIIKDKYGYEQVLDHRDILYKVGEDNVLQVTDDYCKIMGEYHEPRL